MKKTIKIENKTIPVIIRNYKNTNKIKMFFHKEILCISKPKNYGIDKINKLINENKDIILKQYNEQKKREIGYFKQWRTDEKILYKGEQYTIYRYENTKDEKIEVIIDENKKIFEIKANKNVDKKKIDKVVKEFFKIKTKAIIEKNISYWANLMKLEYNSVRISDTISKYGSCIPQNKSLQFSARLCMLSKEEIEAVIVHELSHLKHANHSKDFYDYINIYFPNYKKINEKLKKNGKNIIF